MTVSCRIGYWYWICSLNTGFWIEILHRYRHTSQFNYIQPTRGITVLINSPGFSISVVSGCLLKGSVSEFNKWRVMTARSIILPLVGRITGSCISVIIRGSVTNKTNLHTIIKQLVKLTLIIWLNLKSGAKTARKVAEINSPNSNFPSKKRWKFQNCQL